MNEEHIDQLVDLARQMPRSDVGALAEATLAGAAALATLRAVSAGDRLRLACSGLYGLLSDGVDRRMLAGVLLGASEAVQRLRSEESVDVVWSGPASSVTSGRLTSQAIADTLGRAKAEILVIGFAAHNEPRMAEEMRDAVTRGVEITLLLERPQDNDRFQGTGTAFPDVRARRLVWPAEQRPSTGAALHAKALVVDRRLALVGSANLTGWGLDRNLECGVLVSGGTLPRSIHEHIDDLVHRRVLARLAG